MAGKGGLGKVLLAGAGILVATGAAAAAAAQRALTSSKISFMVASFYLLYIIYSCKKACSISATYILW